MCPSRPFLYQSSNTYRIQNKNLWLWKHLTLTFVPEFDFFTELPLSCLSLSSGRLNSVKGLGHSIWITVIFLYWPLPFHSVYFFGSQHGSIWSFLLINFLPYTWAFTLNTKSQKIDIFKDLVDSSALSSSGDIEHSSCCLSGDKCQRIKASIRKKYYLITKYVQWPFNRNFPVAFSVYWEWLG